MHFSSCKCGVYLNESIYISEAMDSTRCSPSPDGGCWLDCTCAQQQIRCWNGSMVQIRRHVIATIYSIDPRLHGRIGAWGRGYYNIAPTVSAQLMTWY